MKTILIVEDEKLLLEVFSDTLRETGYNIVTALDGKTTLKHLEEAEPDLMILDIKLPDVSGLELLKKTREIYPDIPIIICTAYDSFKSDVEVGEFKVSDYIVKPVDLKILREKVKENLRN